MLDAIVSPPRPINEPVLSYAPSSPERAALKAELARGAPRRSRSPWSSEARRSPPAISRRCAPRTGTTSSSRAPTRARRSTRQAIAAARAAHAGLGFAPVDGARRGVPQGRGAARGVAPHAPRPQRRDDARAEQDGAPGRDRRRLRAHRLPPLQRALRAAIAPSSRSHRACGTCSSRARSRASSSRHALQLHRHRGQPARRRRRSWATPWCGSRRSSRLYSAHFLDAALPRGGPARRGHQPRDGPAGARSATRASITAISRACTSPARRRSSGSMWKRVGDNITRYRSYPRVVGETGGKDFVFAHPSADVEALAVALVRGAFEFQGQKCSAASRAYIPRSIWPALKASDSSSSSRRSGRRRRGLPQLHGRGHRRPRLRAHHRATSSSRRRRRAARSSRAGGRATRGLVRRADARSRPPTRSTVLMREEIFGPVLTVWVYPDGEEERALELCDTASTAYALTGAIFGQDRAFIERAMKRAALLGGQLLHQRQAHRRRRRAAALRRRARLGHERQGRAARSTSTAGSRRAR
jgi:1-pyrroline-5-carboxylate dehydrogenase